LTTTTVEGATPEGVTAGRLHHTRGAGGLRGQQPGAQVLVYPNADHQLTDRARVDRDAFLAEQLQLP